MADDLYLSDTAPQASPKPTFGSMEDIRRIVGTDAGPTASADPTVTVATPLRGRPEQVKAAEAGKASARTEFNDIPDFSSAIVRKGVPAGMRAAVTAFYSLTSDPHALRDMLVKHYGIQAADDHFGNPMVKYDGSWFYLNKPGVSPADLLNAGPQAALFAGTGGVANAATNLATRGAASLLTRGLVQAGTQGATELARQGATRAAGSQQPLSGTDAAIAAALGGAGESVVGLFRQAVRPGVSMLDRAGNWTPEAERTLRSLDLDPAGFTQNSRVRLNGIVRALPASTGDAGLRDAAAAVRDQNLGLRSTAGQRRGRFDRAQGDTEDAMSKGTMPGAPDSVKERMDSFAVDQRRRVMDNATGVGPMTDAAGGTHIYDAFNRAHATSQARVQSAYGAFDATNPQAALLSPQAAGSLRGTVDAALDAGRIRNVGVDMPKTGQAVAMVRRFETPNAAPPGANPPTIGMAPPHIVTVSELEGLRRDLSTLADTASPEGGDQRGVRFIIRELDRRIDALNAMPNAIQGSQQAIPAWRAAIAARRQHGADFEPDPEQVGQGVAGSFDKLAGRDQPSPEQVAKWVLGPDGVPTAGGQLGLSMVRQLRQASPAVLAPMRQTYLGRIMEPVMVEGPRDANLAKLSRNLKTAIEDYTAQGDTLANTLLTPAEVADLRALRSHIEDIQKGKAAYPDSGTAGRLARRDKGLLSWLERNAPWLGASMTGIGSIGGFGAHMAEAPVAAVGALAGLGGAGLATVGIKGGVAAARRAAANRAVNRALAPWGPNMRPPATAGGAGSSAAGAGTGLLLPSLGGRPAGLLDEEQQQ